MRSPIDRADLERGRASDPLVRARGLHHVELETTDLDAAERFYGDFGLLPSAREDGALYLRAMGDAHHVVKLVRGARPRLAAVALSVGTELDLRKLASLPGGELQRVGDPGGGLRVRLRAPGGLVVDAVHDVAKVPELPSARAGAARPVRVPPAPCEVRRIGHVAIETTRPSALVLWLLRTFGMIVSDHQPLEDAPGAPSIVSFLRCDRGATPADHHTLAIALGPRTGLAHVAFEVADVDEIGRGAAYLAARGHRHAWGIGRHLLGSQLFDYWRAPDGAVVEHYADGDLLDASAPTGRLAFRGSHLAQWGGPPPRDFTLPAPSFELVAAAARELAASDEASLSLLARAARALAL